MVLIVAAPAMAGCAMKTTLGPMFASEEVTGSITAADGRFDPAMSEADWAAAREAVDKATAEPGATEGVAWSSPAGGMRGSVTPVATAFAAQQKTCRAFIASVIEPDRTNLYQGQACRGKGGLTIGAVRPFDPQTN